MKRASKTESKGRRIARVRAKVTGTAERPRLTVRRTLAHIYAQVIDDSVGKTLAAASDADVKAKGLKKAEIATEVGKILAERAMAKKVLSVVFDRRDKKYHGRVKALADGARAGGLTF
ncbi:MAG: 50S ribosomal protein L18 [Patescibacteria group bacterium]